ncbi:hypothetical protein VCJ71_08225 [Alteriqipengyuania sp. WL0013]|uniref:hypothetical protein n=1 Tax=Alteriqipengyuania sp. WL0013 TaxID=3110773 RepID=UPI002BCE6C6A|nr:hypothetical protein [Alteriqipengyuania sp. WL0013]MEB3416048.1 hypothetical protein [Alteriqipengyuania sp. WL0013]
MSEVHRRYRLVVAEEVAADLIRVRSEDKLAYDEMQVLFEDLEGDEGWCDAIADPTYSDSQIESVKALRYLANEGRNVYRVKFLRVRKWRIITAANHQGKIIGILGIMHRDQNYEDDSTFSKRIRQSYDTLGFPIF